MGIYRVENLTLRIKECDEEIKEQTIQLEEKRTLLSDKSIKPEGRCRLMADRDDIECLIAGLNAQRRWAQKKLDELRCQCHESASHATATSADA